MNEAITSSQENPYTVHVATLVGKRPESEGIATYRLELVDPQLRQMYRFAAGQFNMLSVFGVGEVPISILSDPDEPQQLDHTIRVVGRVTRALDRLAIGDRIGVRGPFGRGWPLETMCGQDVVVVTGGLGCAPVMGALEYIFRRRDQYGRVTIVHGVKRPKDLLYRDRFEEWRHRPRTAVLLASDQAGPGWHDHVGVVTELFEQVQVEPGRTVVLMCGPEIMMRLGAPIFLKKGVPASAVHLSLERHMECGMGLCGHCQLGPFILCKDGPVMSYDRVGSWLGRAGV